MQTVATLSRPAIGQSAAVHVGLYLAGLAGEGETASQLGIDGAQLRQLLSELSLADCTMMPVGIDDDLGTRFLDIGGDRFDAPTFDEVIEKTGSRAAFSLPADAIIAAPLPPGSAPHAVILHVGRCGSTLLCNLLASGGDWIALREPEFCNRLFLARAATSDPADVERIETLIARLIGCLARGVRPRKSIVKLSSWTAPLAAPLLARLPRTRVIVLVRDPWSTVASFLAELPHWYGDCPVGRTLTGPERADAARFFAQAWCSAVRAAGALPVDRTSFLHYDDLVGDPVTVLRILRRHMGDIDRPADSTAVERTMAYYSKAASTEPFNPSGKHKRALLDGDLRDIVTAIATDEWRACLDRQLAHRRPLNR
ncbi:sulfotransferase [Sphingopyxis panaciterrae]